MERERRREDENKGKGRENRGRGGEGSESCESGESEDYSAQRSRMVQKRRSFRIKGRKGEAAPSLMKRVVIMKLPSFLFFVNVNSTMEQATKSADGIRQLYLKTLRK